MTRQQLCEILELFAVCVLKTAMTEMDPDTQHEIIVSGIENVADSVMVCNKRDALRYSMN